MSFKNAAYSFTAFCLVFFSLLFVGGCAHEEAVIAPIAPKSVVTKPLEKSIKNALEFEEKGQLTSAVDHLKVALTIDPANVMVKDELKRLMAKRDLEAEKHYKAGLALREADNPDGARKEFIAALRINFDYMEAARALKDLQLESSEATLQMRAKKEAATAKPQTRPQPKNQYPADEELADTYLDTAIAFYDAGNFPSAIQELQKARSRTPNDPDVNKYLNLSWYNSGIIWFKKKEYKKALEAFGMVKKKFESVEEYIGKCLQAQKNEAEELYKNGLKSFREQKLQDAIAKWNAVLEINPNHIKAKEYIEKATKLLNALKERR